MGARPGAAQVRPIPPESGLRPGPALSLHPALGMRTAPLAPACTWPAGSSRRPAAARRRCARARAPGGTAHASAPAWRRRCSRWARGRMGYFSGFGDPQSRRPDLREHFLNLSCLFPPRRGSCCSSWAPAKGEDGSHSTGLGDRTQHLPSSRFPFCCPRRSGHPGRDLHASSHPPGPSRETSTALTQAQNSHFRPGALDFLVSKQGKNQITNRNLFPRKTQPCGKISHQLQESWEHRHAGPACCSETTRRGAAAGSSNRG